MTVAIVAYIDHNNAFWFAILNMLQYPAVYFTNLYWVHNDDINCQCSLLKSNDLPYIVLRSYYLIDSISNVLHTSFTVL